VQGIRNETAFGIRRTAFGTKTLRRRPKAQSHSRHCYARLKACTIYP